MNKKYISFCLLFFCSIITIGCSASYLPWNAGTRWNLTDSSYLNAPQIQTNYALQHFEDMEDFCEDNRHSVELYRTYLLPTYTWDRRLSPSQIESRRENIQSFIEQYDGNCN